jgi:hypothetical protein
MHDGPFRTAGDPGPSVDERRRELFRQLSNLMLINVHGKPPEERAKLQRQIDRIKQDLARLG